MQKRVLAGTAEDMRWLPAGEAAAAYVERKKREERKQEKNEDANVDVMSMPIESEQFEPRQEPQSETEMGFPPHDVTNTIYDEKVAEGDVKEFATVEVNDEQSEPAPESNEDDRVSDEPKFSEGTEEKKGPSKEEKVIAMDNQQDSLAPSGAPKEQLTQLGSVEGEEVPSSD